MKSPIATQPHILFDCGCTHHYKSRDIKKATDHNPRQCKIHGSNMVHVKSHCKICDTPFIYLPVHRQAAYRTTCENCRAGGWHGYDRRMIDKMKLDLKKEEASSARYDCKFRDDCLSENCRTNKSFLPCLGCHDYSPAAIESDVFYNNGGRHVDQSIYQIDAGGM
jgi:hypothetical protein